MKKVVTLLTVCAISFCLGGCSGPSEQSSEQPKNQTVENTAPFELDAEISGNGMTVNYPSSWTLKEGVDPDQTYIYPSCGGVVLVDPSEETEPPITKESAESVVDATLDSYFNGLSNGDASIKVIDKYTKRVKGDAITATAPVEIESDGVKYAGYAYAGLLDNHLYSVFATVPEDADGRYEATISSMIDAVKLVRVEPAIQNSADKQEAVTQDSKAKEPAQSSVTTSQMNALAKAKSYLNYTAFSYTGLIEQLEYEKFSTEDAMYGADNCGADWNEQAAKKAASYLDYTSFSRDGLIDQLIYEGFTYEQATYGVDSVGL